MKEQPKRDWHPLSTDVKGLEYIVSDLSPRKTYMFRVRAKTPTGDLSEASIPVPFYPLYSKSILFLYISYCYYHHCGIILIHFLILLLSSLFSIFELKINIIDLMNLNTSLKCLHLFSITCFNLDFSCFSASVWQR